MTNLVRWTPFYDMISLREAMGRLFEESVVQPRAGWLAPIGEQTLAVDMYETDDAVIVKSAIPGVKPDDLDIRVTGDTLTIKGETKTEEEVKEKNYIRRERRHGSFCRALTIPVPVVTNESEAEFKDGILTLTLPKAEEVKPRAIKVKTRAK
ncbi:MAG: Hsp20/alpha crystallin family protein [Chloroflexota bacterium]|nr:Hsp20/alpha crystallin family protein [Chloroflexota bacterium]